MTKEDILEMLEMIGRDTPEDEIESLRAQLAAANAEVQEQARLNGMGSEREAKLRAQLEEFSAELEIAKGTAAALEREFDNHTATQAHAARLAEDLQRILENDGADGSKVFNAIKLFDARVDAKTALSTTINLDALHEDRARTLEEAKRRWYAGEFPDNCAKDALQKMADQHRAKKEEK